MKKKTLTDGLTKLSLVKKLTLSKDLVDVWFSVTHHVCDETADIAFEALLKRNTFGAPEPADFLAEVDTARNNKIKNQPYEWIKDAPKFEGTKDYFNPSAEFSEFLRTERQKKYLSKDSRGEVFLIINPEAWHWRIDGEQVTMIRPKPTSTGTIQPEPKTRNGKTGMWERW